LFSQSSSKETIAEHQEIIAQWYNREMSTYKYIYLLNLIAGRSPNIRNRYIIMPRLTNPSKQLTLRSFITEPPCFISTDKWFKFFKIMNNNITISADLPIEDPIKIYNGMYLTLLGIIG